MKKLLVVLMTLALLVPAACGFAEAPAEVPSEGVGIANPWRETTAEDLFQIYGYAFATPIDAMDIVYRINDELQMAEMQFKLDTVSLTARVAASDPEDISGTYYEQWDVEEPCAVDRWEGTVKRVTDGDTTIDVCLWYDADQGLNYAVVAEGADLDGFDVLAVAEQVYIAQEAEAATDSEDDAEAEEAFEEEWQSEQEAESAEEVVDPFEAPEATEEIDPFEAEQYYGETDESEAYDYSADYGYADETVDAEAPAGSEPYYEEPALEEAPEY